MSSGSNRRGGPPARGGGPAGAGAGGEVQGSAEAGAGVGGWVAARGRAEEVAAQASAYGEPLRPAGLRRAFFLFIAGRPPGLPTPAGLSLSL